MSDAELMQLLDRMKSTMIAVSTGGPQIGEVEGEFTRMYDKVAAELKARNIPNTLPYRDLWEWYGRWSSGDMPKWQMRREFVGDMFRNLIQTIQAAPAPVTVPPPAAATTPSVPETSWDVFISHASEDKDDFVRPLAELLSTYGLKVWYDEMTLTIGDSLRQSIDKGLANSRFGVVVLSSDFLRKPWPQRELDGLFVKEDNGDKVILPIWHRLGKAEVEAKSPILAGRLAASSEDDIETVANDIIRAIQRETGVNLAANISPRANLVAFGPSIVCAGELLSTDHGEWRIRVSNFIVGEIGSLIRYAEDFEVTRPLNRYVLVNALGDGRVLTGPLSIKTEATRHIVTCPIASSAPRQSAQELGSQMATSEETNDLYVKNGSIARVSGVESLPQVLRQTLSMMQGEAFFARDAGARLQEYFYRYRGSPHLLSMLKLDLIRLAAIPYHDGTLRHQYTPLHCVERVWSMKLLAAEPEEDRIPMLLDLEIKGLGRGEYTVSVLMPPMDKLKVVSA